jgi:F-type H+-transporting ATPase subunit b
VLIDWFTVGAQIVNFLILVALLKHFLYGRIVQAMETRECTIATRLEDAATQRAEAQRDAEHCRQQRALLEATRDEFLAHAKKEAEERRIELEQQAREEVDHIRYRWHEALRQEQDVFLQELRERVATQVCAIARRALSDLANVELEQQVVEVFLTHVENLDEKRGSAFSDAIVENGNALVVQSAFELPDRTRRKLGHALRERFAQEAEIRFIVAPKLGCGVVVEAHGQKIEWGIDPYIDMLQHHISTVMTEKAPPSNGEAKAAIEDTIPTSDVSTSSEETENTHEQTPQQAAHHAD